MDAAIVLVLLGLAIFLLATERLRADVVALMILAALMLFRILPPQQSLSGFSNAATVTVAAMFVLSAGLQSSGVVQWLGDRLLKHGPSGPVPLLFLCAVVISPVSAFINNTAAVAVFLPVALRACQGNKVNPSRILMPLSFFAMLGGMCTLVGTSTNILVSSMAAERNIPPLRMFEFTPLGAILLAVGVAWILLVGHRLLPDRTSSQDLTESFHLNRYLSEVVVLPGSNLIGQTLKQARLGENYELEVLDLIRKDRHMSVPAEEERLEEGDLLLVKAPAKALMQLRDAAGIAIKPGRHPADADLRSADSALMEAVVAPNSTLDGRTLKGVNFRNTYGATALAIRRHGEEIREKLGRVILRFGDELLILAPRHHLERLRMQSDLVVLQEVDIPLLQPLKALLSMLIVAGVVVSAAAGLATITEAAVIGAVTMVLTGCLPIRVAYQRIEWRVIFLLAGIIPLGTALEVSGAADMVVGWILGVTGSWGPHAVLTALVMVTSLLTGFMSNNASAALLVPLAVTSSHILNVSPRPMLFGIAFAASAAFYTPIGYQTNLLVYGPGGYRFTDYLKAGGPLTLIVVALASLLIPMMFPF